MLKCAGKTMCQRRFTVKVYTVLNGDLEYGTVIQNTMQQIRDGMTVYDRTGAAIGVVEFVRFGEEDPTQPGPETITGSEVENTAGTWLVESIAEVFGADDNLPDTLRSRLIRHGFVRVDAGLLASDRFVLPDQIASVTNEGVRLHVTDDELIKA